MAPCWQEDCPSVQRTERGRWLTRRRLLRAGVATALAPLAPLLAACDRSTKAPLPAPERRTASAPGVTPDTVTLGSMYPLSGPASAYAPIVQTMDAYFKKVNDDGGVNGRTIKFIVEDDQYSPPRALPLAKKLVEQDSVFALVGNLGTATTVAIAGYTNQQKVPVLFVVSGGEM